MNNLDKAYINLIEFMKTHSVVILFMSVILFVTNYIDTNINGYYIIRYSLLSIFSFYLLNKTSDDLFHYLTKSSNDDWIVVDTFQSHAIRLFVEFLYLIICIIGILFVFLLEQIILNNATEIISYLLLTVLGYKSLLILIIDKYEQKTKRNTNF